MKVTYYNQNFEEQLRGILQFQTDQHSEWWRQSLFSFYPQLDYEAAKKLKTADLHVYIEEQMKPLYEATWEKQQQKRMAYQEHWNMHEKQITEALSEAFATDLTDQMNDMKAMVTLNPICPRYLHTRTFDLFYQNSHRGAIGMSIHEIIHFIWFMVWQDEFRDSEKEYETPHLKWLLSEAAVEPIMHDTRLASLNPYFEHKQCVYEYFYTMTVEQKPLLETLRTLYTTLPIRRFMQEGYAYMKKHEGEIRMQVL